MTAHTTRVEWEGRGQYHVWYFSCAGCGAVGELRLTHGEAERDGEEHERDHDPLTGGFPERIGR